MDLLGFALAVLVIELTPGPNMTWLAGLAATEGRRCGLAAVWGVALGLLVNGVVAALGLAVLLQTAPQLMTWLRLAGAAMMAWLAIATWRGAGRHQPASSTARRAFTTGFTINVLNPKAYVFFVVVIPQFLDDRALTLPVALIFSLVSATIATLVHTGIVVAGGTAHAWLGDPSRTRTVRRVFAVIMLGVALSFLAADFG